MIRRVGWLAIAMLAGMTSLAAPAPALEPPEVVHKGTFAVSLEGGGGEQRNVIRKDVTTGLTLANGGVRFSLFPFDPIGRGLLYGAFEVGVEPYYQRYTDPVQGSFEGLAAVFRYHFLSLGRFVPWVEALASAGASNLRVHEIRSHLVFLLDAGAGASYFVTERAAIYVGYRFQHVSNGDISPPNQGFEAHAAVAGVSLFFP